MPTLGDYLAHASDRASDAAELELILKLVLEQTGPIEIDLSAAARARSAIELRTLRSPDGTVLELSVLSQLTLRARLTELLAEAFDDHTTSHEDDADRIIAALNLDPNVLLAAEEPTP